MANDVVAVGRVAKQTGAKGFYAEVAVRFDDGDRSTANVALAPSAYNEWYQREGWLDAALFGALLGLKLAKAPRGCTITRVHGMICDTSPAVVAIAAIRAAWAGLAFVPDPALAARMDVCIIQSHTLKLEELEDALRA